MKIVDLSKPLYTGMPIYPGDPDVQVQQIHTLATHTWRLRKLTMGSHTGTHVDAFSHMDQAGLSLDQIPLNRFMGPAKLTGLDSQWQTGIGLLFSDEIDIDSLDKLLASRPNFVGGNITEPLERALLQQGVITYTGLVNLEKLPLDEGFTFIGLPLNIKDGDGSPVRAIAILDDKL